MSFASSVSTGSAGTVWAHCIVTRPDSTSPKPITPYTIRRKVPAARGHRLREVGDPAFRTAEVGLERPADLGGAGRPMFIPSGEVADHLLEARRGEDVLLEYRDNHVMQTFHGDHPPVGTHGRATATAGPAGIV